MHQPKRIELYLTGKESRLLPDTNFTPHVKTVSVPSLLCLRNQLLILIAYRGIRIAFVSE